MGQLILFFFNDTILWTASTDRSIRSWDLRSGNQINSVINGQFPALKVESGIGPHIITHDNHTVRVYDIRNNSITPLFTIQTPGITCTSYTSENRYAVGLNTGDLRLFNLNTGAQLFSSKLHYQPITCLHADGDYAVTGSVDTTCKLWNIKTNSLVHNLVGHKDGAVNSIQMDENRIVSGGSDMCLKVWNRKTGASLYSLLGGSRQERGNNPPHPTKVGCSMMKFDHSRIVAAFNSLLRVYSFECSE